MATFISRFDAPGAGLRVAVKDLIDMAGVPTTAGSKALADAPPATRDAACLAEIRRREARGEVHIVGKTNLHELAYGVSGINPWFGTPVNPLDASLVPGGSSSGSAVAVATGEADVALGSDTGGSVRIPAACCGVCGLKTTWGRVSLDGVWPLAPSLDTVGPMARDVAGLVTGMQLLEPGFAVAADVPPVIGRIRVRADEVVDAAVDAALSAAGFDVVDVDPLPWASVWELANVVLSAEAWRCDRELLAARPDDIDPLTARRIIGGADITAADEAAARDAQARWQGQIGDVLARTPVLALPTLATLPPALDAGVFRLGPLTLPVNFAGLPALALPVPTTRRLPASLQLVAASYAEDLLLATGLVVEAAVNQR